ncbi:hypothetical protein [Leuconostoc palmae]|uniref:hypothetical protein n=1 Tax=Leuconostoc palmae TaxID=501487 RepID=UPI001C7D655E|nr:hypothetical protein [Leuconostoc palmae]
MDAVNQDRFNKQMLFLKTASFGEYLRKWLWFCTILPLLSFLINFDINLIVLNILRMVLVGLMALWTIYSMYLFFKPLAATNTLFFSKLKLFEMYFFNMTMLWFLLNINLDTNKSIIWNIIISLGLAVFFGLIMSAIMASCMNQNIKVFIQNKIRSN